MDNRADSLDVDAAGGDVRGDEGAGAAGLAGGAEAVERLEALALLHLPVERLVGHLEDREDRRDAADGGDGVGEDEGAPGVVLQLPRRVKGAPTDTVSGVLHQRSGNVLPTI